jgi:hypothetical protein
MTSPAAILVGTWLLERWELIYADGRPPECPLGADAIGFLMYTADGHVSASLARAQRPNTPPADPQAKARAYEDYFAYAGRYVVPDGTVEHHIAIASDPALAGVVSRREVQIEGDRLLLSGPDFSATSPRAHRITWRRAPHA